MKSIILGSLIALNFISPLKSNDAIISELSQDLKFDENKFIIDKNCANHQDFKGIMLYEHESNDLIFYLFNQAGFGILNVDDCRITMSVNSSNYEHYDLTYLGNSNDNKFYKFKINDYVIDYSISERVYNISEFELKQERVFKGDNAIGVKAIENYYSCDIGQTYSYDANGYTVTELTTLDLNVNGTYYRVPGSKNSYPTFEIVQSDIFYIYFNLPNNYGDLISINIDWYENFYHYREELGIGNFDSEYYDDTYENKYVNKIINETDYSVLDENKFYFFNPSNWFVGGSKGYNLKNLQKFTLDDLPQLNNEDNNYCLDEASIAFIKENLSSIISSPYVIRFDVKDFCKHSYSVSGELGSIRSFNEYKRYTMTDVDVITCTFKKNGEVYTLPVVSNTNNILTDDDIVPNNDFLEALKKLFFIAVIVICFILLIPLLPSLINLLIYIVKIPFRLIAFIVKKFKKGNKDE